MHERICGECLPRTLPGERGGIVYYGPSCSSPLYRRKDEETPLSVPWVCYCFVCSVARSSHCCFLAPTNPSIDPGLQHSTDTIGYPLYFHLVSKSAGYRGNIYFVVLWNSSGKCAYWKKGMWVFELTKKRFIEVYWFVYWFKGTQTYDLHVNIIVFVYFVFLLFRYLSVVNIY